MSLRRVTLLSDFGTVDGYAAAMAAVIATAAPASATEHAGHDIAPGDIFGAALALSRYAMLYPPGTVHLVVVDPGVGTERRAIAATVEARHFVAPDNGVLSLVLRDASRVRMVEIENAGPGRDAAPTFHGRDIFAPAAAHLARSEPLEALGAAVDDPVTLDIPSPKQDDAGARGQVIHVDRFGTLITNIPAAWLRGRDGGDRGVRVRLGGMEVGPVRRTYGDAAPGELVALVGSLDLLEVSVRDGSAAARTGAGRGAAVEVSSLS